MGFAQKASGSRRAVRGVLAALAATAVFGLAEPASADVSVVAPNAQQYAGARFVFQVTNPAGSTTSIVGIEVRVPAEAQIVKAYIISAADWAPRELRATAGGKSVTTGVNWITMPGKDLKPGASAELQVEFAPMPATDALYVDVTQTRSDGSVETWAGVDTPAASAQHPALKVALLPQQTAPVEDPGAADPNAAGGTAAEPAEETSGSRSGALLAILLLIAAVAAIAVFWRRRPVPDESADLTDASDSDDVEDADAAPAAKPAPAAKKTARPAPAPAPAAKKTARPAPAPRKTPAKARDAAPARTPAKAAATRKAVQPHKPAPVRAGAAQRVSVDSKPGRRNDSDSSDTATPESNT
jgi:hypothetical protein